MSYLLIVISNCFINNVVTKTISLFQTIYFKSLKARGSVAVGQPVSAFRLGWWRGMGRGRCVLDLTLSAEPVVVVIESDKIYAYICLL